MLHKRSRDTLLPSLNLKRLIASIARTTTSLGQFDAYVGLLEMLDCVIAFDRAQVMYYPKFSRPRYLFHINTPEDEQASYLEKYRYDPFYRFIAEGGASGVVHLAEVRASTSDMNAYLEVFFPTAGMSDELAVLLPAFGGGVVGIFLQRRRAFTAAQIEIVKTFYPLIESFHQTQDRLTITTARTGPYQDRFDRHVILLDEAGCETFRSSDLANFERTSTGFVNALTELAGKPSGSSIQLAEGTLHIEDLGDGLASTQRGRICFFHGGPTAALPRELSSAIESFLRLYDLSKRQSEIIELTLLGYSSHNIARKFALSEGTVRNHRKLIYDKMDVTTEREIFSMFLKHLTASN